MQARIVCQNDGEVGVYGLRLVLKGSLRRAFQ
jgi:hypothetical protein